MSERELFRLDRVPVYQNKMFDSVASARDCPVGDVVLVQNMSTGLVYNTAYDPSLLSYDETYQNEQGHSPTFQAHMNEVLGKIDLHFAGQRILEVGCGKGAFLELIRQRGHDAIGVDPAYEGNAPYIHKQHFDTNVDFQADAIVLRHVLEHIPQPVNFLQTIALANNGSGKIYVEVPCLDWIIHRRAWFDVFYEHVNYFRLIDFQRIFGTIYEMGRLFDGQYIYAVAELSSLRDPALHGPTDKTDFPMDFMDQLNTCLDLNLGAERKVVWGAAAKGMMFSHHMASHGSRLDFAIDINPAKQNKFMAGSALHVVSPTAGLAGLSAGDNVFVMNSNYSNEIADLGGSGLNYILVDRQ